MWDISDAKDRDERSKTLIASAYRVRAVSTIALLLGQGGTAFSQASALFHWLSVSVTDIRARAISTTFSELSARLAANRAAMLWLSRLSWIGGAIVLASSITLLILDEDALEAWCSKCCFRFQKSHPGYASDAEELEKLFGAIGEVM
ncbi:hypothetical protein IAE35_24590 [Pseudomonas sp. S75]|nr:hypothetical protein [Pseudomonas sp. S30]MBK0156522.1 hypothetical protein [Pseudomonas sp. S75]